MPLDPDPLWQAIARESPDARTQRSVGEKYSQLLGWMERIFCISCGADGGMVTRDSVPHVSYLCNKCFETHGGLPLPEIPEALVRGTGN